MFGRRARQPAATGEAPGPGSAPASGPVSDSQPEGPGLEGKGRPTPKRREAERRRRSGAITAPKSRKEAREELRRQRAEARQALATGDERRLPRRDAGPVRRYVRDYVDARRNAAGLFLPVALLSFSLSLGPVDLKFAGAVLMYAFLLVVIADSVLLVRGMRRGVRSRFPTAELRGLTSYAVMRALQVRRLRLPPPKVPRGARID